MNKPQYRIEHDSLGEVQVPQDALYGAQTQRALDNFKISNYVMPMNFITAVALIKHASATANYKLKLLDKKIAHAIIDAVHIIQNNPSNQLQQQFLIDVFQTGSATSTNMNVNEVISGIANKEFQIKVHPNDHVNMSQSSNDVIPSAIRVSVVIAIINDLIPSIKALMLAIAKKAKNLNNAPKTGRTHLMDAMPITFTQELMCWHDQLAEIVTALTNHLTQLQELPLGGTAVGTGINAHPKFAKIAAKTLTKLTGIDFSIMKNCFKGISSQDTSVACSGILKTSSVTLMKIANDLRWMNSGPIAGLGEIELQAIQPGSSIMPGKVNPVIPEAVTMVCAEIIGNDSAITVAGQSGNFQLNVMLPLIAYKLLTSIQLLTNACTALTHVIDTFKVNTTKAADNIHKSPILITALNPIIGYELGAKIAKEAYQENLPVLEVALKYTNLSRTELQKILDPLKLVHGGINFK